MSISSRVSAVYGTTVFSQSAVGGNLRYSYAIASEEFAGALTSLQQVAKGITDLEATLEAQGHPGPRGEFLNGRCSRKFSQVLNPNGHLSSTTVLSFLLAVLVSSNAVAGLGDTAAESSTLGVSHNVPELLVGDTSTVQLFDAHPRFAQGYEAFGVTKVLQLPDEVSVLLFFGTWCHDSEREVPRLVKSYLRRQA